MFSELAEISRNTSVISSSSSSSSLSDLPDPRTARPPRTFAAPRSASDTQSASQLPDYIQRELGLEPSARFNSPHDFQFGDILGHGSYSTVIQAHGKKSARPYAIKVLDKAHLQRHNQRRTAYAEKEALVALGTSHPGIVGLHSTFSDAWSLYFVLDLLPNGDLRALIVRYGSLSLSCTRYYIAQLTDAITFMHSKGVMHRDIKPENLLLDARFRLALADFGTAKVLPSTETRSNTFVGTPQYYSPELLTTSHTCPASDLWALGCVLFELHTGTFAFNGPSPLLTWRLIKALSYTIPDEFDTDAADLVRRLLLLDPADRLGAANMADLKNHAFFSAVDWDTLWDEPHPLLESGLKQPPEPVSPISSDAELSAQLREERMLDEDEDEIAWAKDARIAAYVPGLRQVNGNHTALPAVQPVGEHKFPRTEAEEEGDAEVPYDPRDTAVVEAVAELALEQPVNVDVDVVPSSENGTPPVLVVPVSTPLEVPPPPLEIFLPEHQRFAHLLQTKERLVVCTPLIPESTTPGGLVRYLPRLLTGSLRGRKPKLKERVLVLTDRRVLCVSTGSKSTPTVKAEYVLKSGVKVEARGSDGVVVLANNEKGVPYAFDEAGAQERWMRGIREVLGEVRNVPAEV